MAYIEKSEICNFHLSNLRKSAFDSAANCAMEAFRRARQAGKALLPWRTQYRRGRAQEKPERSAFESVFRRWANAARRLRKKSFSSSTLAGGRGAGPCAQRRSSPWPRHEAVAARQRNSARRTTARAREAPYSPVPGAAQPARDSLLDHHGDALKASPPRERR